MPRAYRLGKRTEQKEATRAAILQAAVDLYGEQGISRTSMAQIARRADVAPGTVLNHFRTKDALDQAMVDMALAEMRMPDVLIFDGATTLHERLRRLARETGGFIDRSQTWYQMWQVDRMTTGAWGEAGEIYGRRWAELERAALGSLVEDHEAVLMVRVAIDPRTLFAFHEQGLSTEAAGDLVADALTPWLEERLNRK